MITETQAKSLIDEMFEDQALVIGGMVALHEMSDGTVWRLIRSLDAIRRKALKRLGVRQEASGATASKRRPDLRPHPAIEEFLQRIRRA